MGIINMYISKDAKITHQIKIYKIIIIKKSLHLGDKESFRV